MHVQIESTREQGVARAKSLSHGGPPFYMTAAELTTACGSAHVGAARKLVIRRTGLKTQSDQFPQFKESGMPSKSASARLRIVASASGKALSISQQIRSCPTALTVDDVAEFLNLAPKKIYTMSASRRIPSIKIGFRTQIRSCNTCQLDRCSNPPGRSGWRGGWPFACQDRMTFMSRS